MIETATTLFHHGNIIVSDISKIATLPYHSRKLTSVVSDIIPIVDDLGNVYDNVFISEKSTLSDNLINIYNDRMIFNVNCESDMANMELSLFGINSSSSTLTFPIKINGERYDVLSISDSVYDYSEFRVMRLSPNGCSFRRVQIDLKAGNNVIEIYNTTEYIWLDTFNILPSRVDGISNDHHLPVLPNMDNVYFLPGSVDVFNQEFGPFSKKSFNIITDYSDSIDTTKLEYIIDDNLEFKENLDVECNILYLDHENSVVSNVTYASQYLPKIVLISYRNDEVVPIMSLDEYLVTVPIQDKEYTIYVPNTDIQFTVLNGKILSKPYIFIASSMDLNKYTIIDNVTRDIPQRYSIRDRQVIPLPSEEDITFFYDPGNLAESLLDMQGITSLDRIRVLECMTI